MFRITPMSDDGQTVHLKVEGRVVGDWVPELDQVCGSCLFQKKKVVLDFTEVTFMDRRGLNALRRLLGERVQITGASLIIQALLGL